MNKLKIILRPIYHSFKRAIKLKRRWGLKNRNFTIISNNCTAGYVYQYYGLPYNTPTAGLFFEASDFVKLMKHPEKYFKNAKLVFIDPAESSHYQLVKDLPDYGAYPVAKLDDIEIFFQHYPLKEEAESKWYRRSSRINYNNIFFLFSENESFTKQTLIDFLQISTPNKICLISKDYGLNTPNVIFDERAKTGLGNLAWTPKIVLSAIPWKKELNKLLTS